MPKAADEVVVDHSRRLHVRVTDRRADEGEAALLQILAERVGLGGAGGDFADALETIALWFAVDEAPDIAVEAAELLLHLQEGARVADRRFDLHAVADDA